MLATIVDPISSSLGASSRMSWVIAAFPIGCSVSPALSGHLTDIFGRRSGLALSYLLFSTGTLLCGLAGGSFNVFLAGRVLQGFGGGALAPITTFIENDIVPLEKRAFIEGAGNIAFGSVQAFGGIYGGLITTTIGWKWAFLIQVPLIVVNAALVLFIIRPLQGKARSSKLTVDWLGCALLLCTIILFQYAMNLGSNDNWAATGVICSFVISAVSFTCLILWDWFKATNPLIPIRSMLQRTVASSQLSFFFASAATMTLLYYMPAYSRFRTGSINESGILFIPYAIAFGLGSVSTGLAVKFLHRYYPVNFVIQCAAIAGTIGFCLTTQSTPSWVTYIFAAILGAGLGGAYVTRLMGLLVSSNIENQALLQGAGFTICAVGYTVGIATASAVFEHIMRRSLSDRFSQWPGLMTGSEVHLDTLAALSVDQREVFEICYLTALRGVFILALAELVVAALVSFCMENRKLGRAEADEKDACTEQVESDVYI